LQIQADGLLTMEFAYGTSNHNGKVQSETITTFTLANAQSSGYDGVNRLASFFLRRPC